MTVDEAEQALETIRHPLATQQGLATFLHILAADQVWRETTPLQRQLIAEAMAPLMVAVRQAQAEGKQEIRLDRPVIDAPPRTLRSLHSKGLLDDQHRLTPKAVHAAFYRPTP
jgi:hypothetical protein